MSLPDIAQIYLAEWPDWGIDSKHPPRLIKTLDSGTRNTSVLFNLNNRRYILRFQPASNVVDTRSYQEFEIQSAAANLGIAPTILYLDGDMRYQIIEYVAGVHPCRKHLSKSVLECLCKAVIRFQRIDTSHLAIKNYNYIKDLKQYWHACETQVRDSGEWIKRFETAREIIENYENRYGQNRALVHHDLNPLNIILRNDATHTRCVFIDWEFAGVGIRSFDFGALVEEFKLPAIEISSLVGMDTDEIVHAATVYREICAFYCAASRLEPE